MRLSDFFKSEDIICDGEFVTLENSNSKAPFTLAYCDTILYMKLAIDNPNVTCIISKRELIESVEVSNKGLVAQKSPRAGFFNLLHEISIANLIKPQMSYGMGSNCSIHTSAQVSEKTRIGDNVIIDENVIIKDQTEIGDNTHIHAGVIIGCDGILYTLEEGTRFSVPHVGGVRIGQNVSILSAAVIVKSVYETVYTHIGDNCLIGIRTTVGHDVQIGNRCTILGNCVLARKACIGNDVWIGTSSVVREYTSIGNDARVMVGSIVVRNVPSKVSVSGNFAIEHSKHSKDFINSIRNKAARKNG